MAAKSTKSESLTKITSVIARESDGNIQITFTIPFDLVKKAQDDTVAEMAKDITVPGFRKGNAPISKAREKISEATLIEHSLSHLLPTALAQAITENKLKIAIYPKFELISAKDNEPWQVRGITCEIPDVDLGDYKKIVCEVTKTSKIIVPGQEDKKELTHEQKEQAVVKALLDNVKITIPKILIEEEVSSRLSTLLSRLEKLGLAIETYLSSIGKTVESLRAEYETQAKEAIALDIILTKISETEKLEVKDEDIKAAQEMSAVTKDKSANPEEVENQKRLIESILKRRQALDFLISLS